MAIDHFQAQRFGRLELLARQAVEGFITGLHKSPYHGFSVEFAEHRAYNTGESTRHIDWKLYGRTDKMFVKRYEEETNLRCNIVIDVSGSMYYPTATKERLSKIQFAIQSAASLIYLLRSQRDAVGITLIGDGMELSTPIKTANTHHSYLFAELENAYEREVGSKKSEIISSLHSIAEKTHKRSLVMIFSDFLDSKFSQTTNGENNNESLQAPLFDALQHMRYNNHEVMLFHLYDKPTEVELQLDNRPYTFEDLETGERVKVMPNEVREQYQTARQQRIDEIKLTCRQYGIDWNEADVQETVTTVLDRFLAKRRRMS